VLWLLLRRLLLLFLVFLLDLLLGLLLDLLVISLVCPLGLKIAHLGRLRLELAIPFHVLQEQTKLVS